MDWTEKHTDAWYETFRAFGAWYQAGHVECSTEHANCVTDAEAGSERAKQYLAAFAAELLKG